MKFHKFFMLTIHEPYCQLFFINSSRWQHWKYLKNASALVEGWHWYSPLKYAWCPVGTTLQRGVLSTNKGNHSRASYMRSPTLALLQTRPPYFIELTARWPTVNAYEPHPRPDKCTTTQIGCANREDTAKWAN